MAAQLSESTPMMVLAENESLKSYNRKKSPPDLWESTFHQKIQNLTLT